MLCFNIPDLDKLDKFNTVITVRNSSCGKVIFSQACVNNSVQGGGMHGRRAYMAGGMCGKGVCVVGACVVGDMHGRGHEWQEACMAGGVHGGGHTWQET